MNNPAKIMARQQPEQIVFSPNLWQWYSHHRDHGILPAELSHCKNLIDVYQHLDTDIWSRNCYCDERRCWFGGLADTVYGNLPEKIIERTDGRDLVIEKAYPIRRLGKCSSICATLGRIADSSSNHRIILTPR